jgi:hypothetical protein
MREGRERGGGTGRERGGGTGRERGGGTGIALCMGGRQSCLFYFPEKLQVRL